MNARQWRGLPQMTSPRTFADMCNDYLSDKQKEALYQLENSDLTPAQKGFVIMQLIALMEDES